MANKKIESDNTQNNNQNQNVINITIVNSGSNIDEQSKPNDDVPPKEPVDVSKPKTKYPTPSMQSTFLISDDVGVFEKTNVAPKTEKTETESTEDTQQATKAEEYKPEVETPNDKNTAENAEQKTTAPETEKNTVIIQLELPKDSVKIL